MAISARHSMRAATYADVEAVPPHLVAEILYGTLVTHPRPAPRHAVAITSLGSELAGPFQKGFGGPGGWIFMVEPELHFGSHVAVPDIAGWRRENLKVLPQTAWIETPPDWICEVISPSTEKYDRGEKRVIYAEAGVKHLWLLDPRSRVLEVFSLSAEGWLLVETLSEPANVSARPFDAISFPLSVLWPFDEIESDVAKNQGPSST